MVVEPLLVQHLVLALGAQVPHEAYLGGAVEPGELCLGVRLDVGRVYVVLDIELGCYPLVRVRELGGVKDHAWARRRAPAAREDGGEQREQEEEDDGEETHQCAEKTRLGGTFVLAWSSARSAAAELVNPDARAAKVEDELRSRVETCLGSVPKRQKRRRDSRLLTAKGTTKTAAAAKEALKHLFWAQLVLPHAATHTAAAASRTLPRRKPTERALLLRLAEAAVWVAAELVILFPLLLVPQHAKGPRHHLEGLVGVLVAVLVGVREQGLLAVGLFDVGLGATRARGLEPQNVVEGGRLAAADAQDGGFLLDRVLALLVALVVFATARRAAIGGGVCARSGGAGRHEEERGRGVTFGDRRWMLVSVTRWVVGG